MEKITFVDFYLEDCIDFEHMIKLFKDGFEHVVETYHDGEYSGAILSNVPMIMTTAESSRVFDFIRTGGVDEGSDVYTINDKEYYIEVYQ